MTEAPDLCCAGDRALIIRFGTGISEETNQAVLGFLAALEDAAITGITDLVPSFASLMIRFDPLVTTSSALVDKCRQVLAEKAQQGSAKASVGRLIEVPVSYGGADGPDLEGVAKLSSMTPEEVVSVHTTPTYMHTLVIIAPHSPAYTTKHLYELDTACIDVH